MSTLEERILKKIRTWWRPITCIWLSGTMFVHGILLPTVQYFRTGHLETDLLALSALVTSVATAFAVREWGKVKGNECEPFSD